MDRVDGEIVTAGTIMYDADSLLLWITTGTSYVIFDDDSMDVIFETNFPQIAEWIGDGSDCYLNILDDLPRE